MNFVKFVIIFAILLIPLASCYPQKNKSASTFPPVYEGTMAQTPFVCPADTFKMTKTDGSKKCLKKRSQVNRTSET